VIYSFGVMFHPCFALSDQPLDARRISTYPCPQPSDLDALFEEVMQKVRRSARGAIAPVACVQAVRAAATLPYTLGLEREKELFATLFTSDQARALQYIFFAQRAVGRWRMPSGASWDTSKPRPVNKAAVIGKSVGLLISVCPSYQKGQAHSLLKLSVAFTNSCCLW